MRVTNRVVLIILALAVVSVAQDVRTGILVGLVTDPTGTAVPNAGGEYHQPANLRPVCARHGAWLYRLVHD
jgi:hypothetical protein